MTRANPISTQPSVPLIINLLVYVALLALLGLTILVAQFDFGLMNVVLALTIAGAKALLIMLYFMHIRYSSPLTRVFAGAGFLWLSILLGLTMCDYVSRTWLAGVQ